MSEAATSSEIDDVLRALASPVRRSLIRLTSARSVPATELADLLGVAAATASEHLKVLRKTALVQMTAAGTWRHYRADLDRVRYVLAAVLHDLLPPTAIGAAVTVPVAHFEITGPNDQALVAFYTELLGWPADSRGPGYTLVKPDSGPAGAIIEAPEGRMILGVAVHDLDAVVERVTCLGGQVVMPPTDNGWVTKALVTDPAGNALSLIQDRNLGAVDR